MLHSVKQVYQLILIINKILSFPPNRLLLTRMDKHLMKKSQLMFSNKDDPSTLVLTFRSWCLGLLFTCLLSFVNQFFWYRTSPLFVGTLVAQLLSYPLGKAMAKFLPERHFKNFFDGVSLSIQVHLPSRNIVLLQQWLMLHV